VPVLPGIGNCQYTAISSAGTTTLNPGQASGPATSFGVLYGVGQVAAGTGFGFSVLDIVPPAGQQAASTNTLINGTGSAGQFFDAAAPDVGVRYRGALVVVTTGTPGAINAFWD
jgi:hypothetical protein